MTSSATDIAGYFPQSSGPLPPIDFRVARNLPTLAIAAVLLFPQRWCPRGRRAAGLLVAYAAVSLWAFRLMARGFLDYLAGGRDPVIIPVGLVFFALPTSQAFAYWLGVRRREREGLSGRAKASA